MEMLGDLCAVGNAANAQDCRNLFPNYGYSSRILWPQKFAPQILKIPSEMEVAPQLSICLFANICSSNMKNTIRVGGSTAL